MVSTASRARSMPWASSARISGLAPWAATWRSASRSTRARAAHVGVGEQLGRRSTPHRPCCRRRPAPVRRSPTGPPARPTPPATRERSSVGRRSASTSAIASAGCATRVTSASSTSPRTDAPAEVSAERLGQPVVERAELEEVEQRRDLVGVGLAGGMRSSRPTSSSTSRSSTITSAFEPRLRLVLGQVLAQLRRLLVDVGEDAVEAAVRC